MRPPDSPRLTDPASAPDAASVPAPRPESVHWLVPFAGLDTRPGQAAAPFSRRRPEHTQGTSQTDEFDDAF